MSQPETKISFRADHSAIISKRKRPNLLKFQEKRLSSGLTTNIFVVLAALLLLGTLWPLLARLDFYGAQLGRRLTYPFFQGSSEGLILSEVAIIRQGGSIYSPFRADLFVSAPYPPLYYYLTAWLSGIFQAAETNFLVGRIISLVAAGATALLIAWQVFAFRLPGTLNRAQLVIKGLVAILAGLIFVTLPAVMVWSARVRADMLMTAFQLGGLALVAEGARRKNDRLVLASVVPFTLALYTKQTALAGPAAAFVFILFYYGIKWRKTATWLILQGLVAGIPFVLLTLATGGELYRRLFKYHSLPWLSANFDSYSQLYVQENLGLLIMGAGLLVLAIVSIIATVRTFRPAPKSNRLEMLIEVGRQIPLALWYLAGSIVLLLGLGVAGADHNHFLPAEAATCLAAGVVVAWLLDAGRWRWLALGGLAVLWLQLAVWSVPANRYEIELRVRDADYQRQLGKIVTYAESRPGAILTSEAGFFVLAGKTEQDGPYYNDLFTLAALDHQGVYSEAGLIDSIRRKQFGVVLSEVNLFDGKGRPDVWTPEMVDVLKTNYFLKFTDVWYTFEPLP